MVNVYRSINEIKWEVARLIKDDSEEILRYGLPPCYREYDNCQKMCSVSIECKANTIVIDQKALKRFGL